MFLVLASKKKKKKKKGNKNITHKLSTGRAAVSSNKLFAKVNVFLSFRLNCTLGINKYLCRRECLLWDYYLVLKLKPFPDRCGFLRHMLES